MALPSDEFKNITLSEGPHSNQVINLPECASGLTGGAGGEEVPINMCFGWKHSSLVDEFIVE